jgi:hypothetical protein
VTPDRYETIRRTLRHVRAQTVRDQLEVVIVAPSVAALGLDAAELDGFQRVQVVEVGPVENIARARATGIRRATAPIVVLTEDHCYPAPDWAAALIAAHRQPWAAVGPAFGNANPGSMTSWANFYIQYTPWIEPSTAGVMDDLPGHNSSYKRALLLDYGSRLDAMLSVEHVLHQDLRARGYQLFVEPAARAFHLNTTRPFSVLREQVTSGRMFAATRARDWSPVRRLLFAGGAPLIPWVRLRRILHAVRRSDRRRELLPGILPPLLVGLVANALGEMIGYALGPGNVVEAFTTLEFHRERHLTARDRHELARR